MGKKKRTQIYTQAISPKVIMCGSWEPLNLVQKLSTGSNPEGHLQRSANSDQMFQLLQIQSYVNIQVHACTIKIMGEKKTQIYTQAISPKVIMCGSWEPLNLVQKLSTGSNPEGHLQRSANSDQMFQLLQIQSYVNIQVHACTIKIMGEKKTQIYTQAISPKVIMCGSWEPLNLVQKLSTGSNPEGHLQRSVNSDQMFQLLQIQSYVNIQVHACTIKIMGKKRGHKFIHKQFRQKFYVWSVMGATKFGTEIYVKTAGVFYVKFRLVTKLEQQYVMNKKMF